MSEYQVYNNDENDFLWKLLADPVNNTHLYTYNLQRLVNNNPQSGIFRALLARTGGEENFKLASVHFNSKSLYKLINYPAGFENVSRDKIIIDAGIPSRPVQIKPVQETVMYESNVHIDTDVAEQEIVAPQPEELQHAEQVVTAEAPTEVAENSAVHIAPQKHVDESEHLMEVSMAAEYDITKGYSVSEPGVFGADVSIEQLKADLKNIKAGVAKPSVAAGNEVVPVSKENKVARFHEEVAPYSFIWWLNKTRKERASNFQPYAKPRLINQDNQKKAVDELQHQYVENIFHLNSVEELEKSTADKPITWDFNKKESKIIERFLEKEPMIKPQQGDVLDTENKAKHSSEDANEIVTETLAAIYAEQMLYQKSIVAYKKLMLRFPEKSSYFADKIEQLEKKTNL